MKIYSMLYYDNRADLALLSAVHVHLPNSSGAKDLKLPGHGHLYLQYPSCHLGQVYTCITTIIKYLGDSKPLKKNVN